MLTAFVKDISFFFMYKNIQYYSERPEILEGIYQEVITELSKKQAKVENETPPNN